MEAIYGDTQYHDVYFKLDSGKIVGAHQVVLATSEVEWFSNAVQSHTGNPRNPIDALRISDETFEIALKWCYRIKTYKNESVENLESYFMASVFSGCPAIVEKALCSLDSSVNPSTLIALGLKYRVTSAVRDIDIEQILKMLENREINDDEIRFLLKAYIDEASKRQSSKLISQWLSSFFVIDGVLHSLALTYPDVTDFLFRTVLLATVVLYCSDEDKVDLFKRLIMDGLMDTNKVELLQQDDVIILPGFPIQLGRLVPFDNPLPEVKPLCLYDSGPWSSAFGALETKDSVPWKYYVYPMV